jgi:prepilin-type N-terminal cleavage/methylation domain-containing protein
MWNDLSKMNKNVRQFLPRESEAGFTLIEMSIVLVIIGLIIGGIVKGQEVVANARAKSQVAQLDAIKGAVYTFQDKFGYAPGDLKGNAILQLAAGTDGNQDGYITVTQSSTVTSVDDSVDVSGSTSESPTAWLQIASAGLLSAVNLNGVALSTATTANYPGKIATSYVWLATFWNSNFGITGISARLQAGTGKPTPILRMQDAASIDQKFDDGSPATGSIYVSAATVTNCVSSTTAGASYTQATTLSNVTLTCVLDFGL